jgi:hypothetical protein
MVCGTGVEMIVVGVVTVSVTVWGAGVRVLSQD